MIETGELLRNYGNLKNVLSSIEIRMIMDAMNMYYGNKTRAARYLGVNRTTLVEKIKKYRIKTIYDRPKEDYGKTFL